MSGAASGPAQPGVPCRGRARCGLFAALVGVAISSPAAAECIGLVSELEQRVVTLKGHEQTVEVRTGSGAVEVEQALGGTRPSESWGGASSAFAGATEKLGDARELAQDGDEDGCRALVEEARVIMQSLEP